MSLSDTMRFQSRYSQDLYFTLKYVAERHAAGTVAGSYTEGTGWPAFLDEPGIESGIDALLSFPLPEIILQQERRRIEASLFGPGRPYTPFL